jgi:hypothetical protein
LYLRFLGSPDRGLEDGHEFPVDLCATESWRFSFGGPLPLELVDEVPEAGKEANEAGCLSREEPLVDGRWGNVVDMIAYV